jgi:hypothetical protein
MEFYVGVNGSRSIAGDIAVSLILFHDQIDTTELTKHLKEYPHYKWGEIKDELIRLSPSYSYRVFKVLTEEINRVGYSKAMRRAIENQTALFALNLKTFKNPTLIISSVDQPPPRHYDFDVIEPDCYTFVAQALSYFHFKEQILFEHLKYPMYGWDTNLGIPTEKHILALLKYGPVFHLHKKKAVLNFAKYLYKRVLRRCPNVKEQVKYLHDPPPWWETHYKSEDYFACISKAKDRITYALANYHDRLHSHYLENLYKYVEDSKDFEHICID